MRVFFGAFLGAVVVFVWGFVAWGVLDVYKFAIKSVPNEAAIVPALKTTLPESGAYFFPPQPDNRHDTAGMDAWAAKYAAGPVGVILYRNPGTAPMHWSIMARGFAMYLAASLVLASLMYALKLRTTSMRLAFAMLMVSFGLLITHGSNWNWMHYPDTYTLALCADGIMGWLLGGGVIAMIVRPPAATA